MAASSQVVRVVIQVILGIIIVGLAYWLYLSITEPYEAVEREQALTRETRDRMNDVRSALIRHNETQGRFPGSLDSLVMFIRQDSLLSMHADSIFGAGFDPDSMIHSPRTGERFQYAVNDTARVDTYLLEDPASDDYIGTLEADITQLNAASWE